MVSTCWKCPLAICSLYTTLFCQLTFVKISFCSIKWETLWRYSHCSGLRSGRGIKRFLFVGLGRIFNLIYIQNYFTLPYFRLNENIHSHDTRSESNIFIEYRRTNYGKYSLKYRGAQIWYNLPNTLKTSKTYCSFKKNAKVCVQSQTTLHN